MFAINSDGNRKVPCENSLPQFYKCLYLCFTPTFADEIQSAARSSTSLLCVGQRHNLSKTRRCQFPFTSAAFEQAFRRQAPSSTAAFARPFPSEGTATLQTVKMCSLTAILQADGKTEVKRTCFPEKNI